MGMGLGWLTAATGAQEGLDTLLARRLKEQENQRRNRQLSDEEAQFAQQMDLRNREFGAESENRRLMREEQARHNKEVEAYQTDERSARANLLRQQEQDREAAQREKDAKTAYIDQQLARPDLKPYERRAYEVFKATGHMPSMEDPGRNLNDQIALLRERDRLDQEKTERKRADDPTLPYGVQDYLGVLRGRHQSIDSAVKELAQNQSELTAAHPKLSISKAVDALKDMYGLPKGYRMNSATLPSATAWPGSKPQTPAPSAGKVTIKSVRQIG